MKRKKPTSSGNPSFAVPELQQFEQLFQFMTEHNLEEFEYSRGDLHIRLRRPFSGAAVAQPRQGGTESIAANSPAPAEPLEARGIDDLHLIKSPIVGTFYGAPTPGADPFVKVGAHVEVGQALCIIEAMKLMNEIESDVSGEIVRIFVENGQPVEYGQALFGVRSGRKK
ncbi:MAG: acetyl-CoA carboxylase, biotin carboxyl carrier protein [Acidobacteria bacterium 13_1_20CM_2_60_10]|nr:MAG: acetyl-CoA carboxylase, biotin carboxyl carrier protein [Acidobacteria bacterium 13_1_20CM_2_60_10]